MKYIIKKFFFIVLLIMPLSVWGDEPMTGETLFKRNCKSCHNLNQKLVGPALSGINERRDSAWIYQFVKGSQAMVEAGDATAVALFQEYNQVIMPNQTVTDDELASILNYIKDAATAKASANPIQRPLVDRGRITHPMKFNTFVYWIPLTIGIIGLIFMLYYMTVLYDLGRDMREGKLQK